MEIKKTDSEETTEVSQEQIAQLQEQLFNLGMMRRKTSGGNKKHMKPATRITRRKMQKASRKVNRPKK